MNFNNYVNILKEKLKRERFEHSLRVVETALKMAQGQQVNHDKIRLAALLHDYAKDLPGEKLLEIGTKHHLITCKAEEIQPDLLHGPVGAFLCREELQITDREVLDAIHYHTTGRINMSTMEKIVYLADLIEPGRTYTGVEKLRIACNQDLSRGILFAFDCTLNYVLKKNLLIHPLTVEARNGLILAMMEE